MSETAATSAVSAVERLLRAAHQRGASDLHIDPSAQGLRVRMRRDGVLETLELLPSELGPQVVGRCKALADLLVYRQDVPQEGRIGSSRSGIGCQLRVATYPTVLGERVALRFDTHDGVPRALADLGLPEPVREGLAAAIADPDGVVLVTGPSGSGKTTTLYSCLHELVARGPERTIVTVEDPVERRIDDVVQTEVNPVAGLDFTRALRSLLRQDPDVILVGEVRDAETAAIAHKAGLTGHLVLSSVHAKSASEAFARLLDLGVEPFVLTTTVRGVLSQRLLRRSCDANGCGAGAADPGCDLCHGTGYRGRVPVGEWLPMHDALRVAVLGRADGDGLEQAARVGATTALRAAAQELVTQGVTDQTEVERVFGRHRS